jgi:hypothetical protein
MALTVGICAGAAAQTPQPFPRSPQPGQTPPPTRPTDPPPATPRPPAPAPAPAQGAPAQPAPARPPNASAVPPPAAAAAEPTAQSLGLPIYPAAQYLTTYDAGRGQKYVLFGTTAAFAEIVTYYKNQLKEGGELVFREPPTHTWDVGRFREETMVFPPGVTVKDFTWGGSKGYPNPRLNGQPPRFPTIIMLVPQPPPAAAAPRQ